MTQAEYVLTIENDRRQRVIEKYDHIPCIAEIAETVNMAKYAMDSPWLTRIELTKGTTRVWLAMTETNTMKDKGHYYTRPIVFHAKDGTAETRDVQCYDLAEQYNFTWGNVVKYMWRWRGKNGLEDLQKAYDYARAAKDRPSPIYPTDARDIIMGLVKASIRPNDPVNHAEMDVWIALAQNDQRKVIKRLHDLIKLVKAESK